MKLNFILSLAVAALSITASAQTQQSDVDFFRQQCKTLGSDDFGGRKPMGPYEQKTINYIADQFKAVGLEPANNGSYFQPVREISTFTRLTKDLFQVKGKQKVDLKFKDDVVIWTSRNCDKVEVKNADLVFCGFGIDAPEYNWNDFDGVDVKGKIILAMVNDPGFYNKDLFRGRNMTYYGRWTYKLEEAERRGALGCLVIHNKEAASYGWEVPVSSHTQKDISLVGENDSKNAMGLSGWINEGACERLFKAAGKDFQTEIAAAKKPGFKPYVMSAKATTTLNVQAEIGESNNVAGILRGSDPVLKDEYVVLTAHWDHFGIGDPINGDSIYNGASDNASGVAAIMTHARMYQQAPIKPRRSIVFVAVTSEECGLLGSQWYCEHPLFPLSKTAANVNVDGAAPAERTKDVMLRAAGKSDLDQLVVAATEAQGRVLKFQTEDPGGGYFRSDHFNFCKKGVPAVLAGGGRDYVDMEYHNSKPKVYTYHQPNDEYNDNWEFDGAMENLNLIHSIVTMIANQNDMPKWAKDADFQRQPDKK